MSKNYSSTYLFDFNAGKITFDNIEEAEKWKEKLEENNIAFSFSISIQNDPECLHPDLPVEDLKPELKTLEIDVPTIYMHVN